MCILEELSAKNSQSIPPKTNLYDYITLLKPRVMSLVVFTALVGLMVSPVTVNPLHGVLAILCIAVGGGGAGALNMWYDADIDAVMKRTKKRPIPTGKISRKKAFVFGLALSVLSVSVMGIFINWFSAIFLAFHNFLLCCYLYDLVKTYNTTKYCYWWCSWSFSTNDWVGSCDRGNKY